jgi:RNA polymerase sigma-70 factor (ECF subfamily)
VADYAKKPLPHQESDRDLINAAAGGDRAALARLYERHAARLLAAGVQTLRSREDAEDVLHDVFAQVWQDAGDYDAGRGSVLTWLLLRMRSRCLDRLRRAGAKAVAIDASSLEKITASPEDPSLGPDRRLVRRALVALPNDQRVALQLAYFQGLSGAEIAARLRAPLGTVKTRMALGIAKLRAALEQEGKK